MSKVLASYRSLIRMIRIRFKGDKEILNQAIENVRARYEANRKMTNQDAIRKKLIDAEVAVDFLRDFVVQSIQREDGCYQIKLTRQQVASMQEEPIEDADSRNGPKAPKI